MIPNFLQQLFASRRSATAVAFAIMFVPMVIGASAAVDFARVASARALMQSAVDGATEAGANAYQISENFTDAGNATTSTLSATSAQLSNFVGNIQTSTGVYCNTAEATHQQCGSTYAQQGTLISQCPPAFATKEEYCVVATMSATLKNSLFAYLLPSEVLTVNSVGTTLFPPYNVSGSNIPPSPGFGSAGDKSSIYAYGVTLTTSGAKDFADLPAPNSACASASGQLPLLVNSSSPTGTTCNYLYVSDSLGDGGNGGSITLEVNQPIAFTFINYTGANGYTGISGAQYTSNLVVYGTKSGSTYKNPTYYQNGDAIYTVVTTKTVCSKYYTSNGRNYSDGQCEATPNTTTTTTSTDAAGTSDGTTTSCATYENNVCENQTSVTISGPTQIYGQCPDHTLYGSISQGYGAPTSDSLNQYSTAYEALGDPPTQYTNHALTPFVTTDVITENIGNTNYYVAAVCPNYPTSGTQINAPVRASYAAANPDFAGMNIYSTWFPVNSTNEVAFSDSSTAPAEDSSGNPMTTGVNDVFPPAIAGCTPATSAADGGVTPTSDDPWWAWSNSNSGNCSGATNTGTSYPQPAAYNNCAFVIQPLGTNVPVDVNNEALVPDYYNAIVSASGTSATILALDPVYDNTTYVDLLTGVTVKNTDPAGYVPTNASYSYSSISATTTIHGSTAKVFASAQASKYIGDYLVVQEPATSGTGQDHNLPLFTSYQCYDPQAATTVPSSPYVFTTANTNGYGYITNGNGAPVANNTVVPGYNADGTPIDPIANPQDAVVYCDQSPPETYALYWNDLGTYESDDLGYWNAVEVFTCSVPPTTNAGGGPSTLSG